MSDIRQKMNSLDKKVALVTGAGGGIGLGIAEAFCALGATLVIVDIDPDRIATAQESLSSAGSNVIGVVADVTTDAGVGRVVKLLDEDFGRLDILVNNVGSTLGMLCSFEETKPEQWQSLYAVNLWHMFAVTHAALPLLRNGGRGASIINISTIEAFRGFPLGTVYAAFKAAVTGFTQSLALELGPEGIRVNAIAPETTATPSVNPSSWLAGDDGSVGGWVPLGRFGEPADAAACAVFLASDMAGWVTGTTLHLDGGCLAAAGWVRTAAGNWTHRPTIDGTHWPRERP